MATGACAVAVAPPWWEKVCEQRPARRFAQVFGVPLECQSPDGNMASVDVAAAYGPGKKSILSPLLDPDDAADRVRLVGQLRFLEQKAAVRRAIALPAARQFVDQPANAREAPHGSRPL